MSVIIGLKAPSGLVSPVNSKEVGKFVYYFFKETDYKIMPVQNLLCICKPAESFSETSDSIILF